MRVRFLIPTATMVAALVVFVGCRDQQADVAGLSRYTTEILIDETLARYKTAAKANRDAGAGAKAAAKAGGTKSKGDDDKEAAAIAKYGDEISSRDAPGTTKGGGSLTGLFDGVVRKVGLIDDAPPDQVYAKLQEAVDYDPELSSDEKDAFKDALLEARKKAR